MPQLHSLYAELSVIQNVDFFARIYQPTNKTERAQRVEEVIKLVNMWPRRKDSILKLSGGMKQRVSLACAIVHNPPLLFLDEPTTGLHFADIENLLAVLHRLVDAGNTVLVIEHNLEVVKTADWIIDLGPEGGDAGGEVVATGTPRQISGNNNSYTGQYLKSVLSR
jgi:excinuclease ABC subunit A